MLLQIIIIRRMQVLEHIDIVN